MSVGHVGRAIEEAGIATSAVFVRSFRHVVDEMQLPRVVTTNHPMGRPLGAAGDRVRQREVVTAALSLIDTAAGRTVIDDPTPFRPISG